MALLSWQGTELRQPMANELAIRIEAPGLGRWVENAEIWRGIGTRGCCPLPAAIIGSEVAIDEMVQEKGFALAPVCQQVLGQEHGSDHA